MRGIIQKTKYAVPGSFTVEAAFVVPLVIWIIMDLIGLGFYLHDETVLTSALHQLGEIGEQYETHEMDWETGSLSSERRDTFFLLTSKKEFTQKLKEEGTTALQQIPFFCFRNCSLRVGGNWFSWQLTAEGENQFPLPLLPEKSTVVFHTNIYWPAEWLRIYTALHSREEVDQRWKDAKDALPGE